MLAPYVVYYQLVDQPMLKLETLTASHCPGGSATFDARPCISRVIHLIEFSHFVLRVTNKDQKSLIDTP